MEKQWTPRENPKNQKKLPKNNLLLGRNKIWGWKRKIDLKSFILIIYLHFGSAMENFGMDMKNKFHNSLSDQDNSRVQLYPSEKYRQAKYMK